MFSAFNGLILQAILTILIMFAAAFLASSITEIVRVLQVRFTGAVYKSSGKAAIWVRLVGSLLIIVIFYIIYFYVISGTSTFISGFNFRPERRLVRAFCLASPNNFIHRQRLIFTKPRFMFYPPFSLRACIILL